MGEAYVIDKVSIFVAGLAGVSGGLTLGPGGAASAYGVTSYAVTDAGYSLASKINSVWFPRLGLGIY
jgi:hypothetical protein